MKLRKRLLSILLCACLLFTFVPHVTPTAEASGLAAAAANLLISRGVMAAVTATNAIGQHTGDTETAALISKWVFGVDTSVLQAVSQLSKQMVKLHEEVMRELDHIENTLDVAINEINDIKQMQGAEAVSAAHDNYNSAWLIDVTAPMALNGYNQVVNAYKLYLEYAGSYKTGSTVSYAGQEMVATEEMVQNASDAFREALVAMSGAVYDSSVHDAVYGNKEGYYDHVLYETNTIDVKVQSTVNNLLGRMRNAERGSRFIDRAAQLAYLYFPFSEDQAEFMDAAVEKQLLEITMALLAYEEFIGLRLEHCETLTDTAAAETYRSLSVIEDLINGGAASTNGFLAEAAAWISEPLYISTSNYSYLYLTDYQRMIGDGEEYLKNTSFLTESDPALIVEESKAQTISYMPNYAASGYITGSIDWEKFTNGISGAGKDKRVSEMIPAAKRAVIQPVLNGHAVVQPIYLLRDQSQEKDQFKAEYLEYYFTAMEAYDLRAPMMDFSVPSTDFYNLRDGEYEDANGNTMKMLDGEQLEALIDNNAFALRGATTYGYFSDLMGTYLEGKTPVLLSNPGTARNENYWRTDFSMVDMAGTGFSETGYTRDTLSGLTYAAVYSNTSGQGMSKLTATADDGFTVTISGEDYDAETGLAKPGSTVTLTITTGTSSACTKLGQITVDHYELCADGSEAAETEVFIDEQTAAMYEPDESGTITVEYVVPYTAVNIHVQSQSGHSYSEHGFCTGCGFYEPATPVGASSYAISNVGQLYWFSSVVRGYTYELDTETLPRASLAVNGMYPNLNGTITAPLDMSVTDIDWYPIGVSDYYGNIPYSGVFDGGNQPITNFNGVLIGYALDADIRNVAIESGTISNDFIPQYGGSIIGVMRGDSTLEHSYSKADCTEYFCVRVGGLVGCMESGTMTDCYYAGDLTGAEGASRGGLVGSVNETNIGTDEGTAAIINCHVSGPIGSHSDYSCGPLVGEGSDVTLTNCYYNADVTDNSATDDSDCARSAVQFASGEVAFLLNADREEPVWYQTIGEQDYPEFTGLQVYHIEEGDFYSNDPDAEAACPHDNTTTDYTYNGGGTHTVTVTCECGETVSQTSEACTDEDGDGYCDACEAELETETPEIEKFNVSGCNMTLGNELELNIFLPKSTVDAYGKELTVTVTHHEVSGDTEYVFALDELPLYNRDTLYKASIRVAAAQMTDLVDIVVTDAEGNVYNNDYSTSVRTYVTNNLDEQDAKVKTLLVDMVNYGAAAQDQFKYRQDDYANAELTEAQKLLATGDVECTDIREKGPNYVGSNLSLEDQILLNFMFTGVSNDVLAEMTAKIEFTGVLGNEVSVTVPAQRMLNRYAGVAVDQIVLADAACPVTVTLYNADGTVYGYATDSVESYNARQNPDGTNALYSSIMKFAASALAYKQ